MEWYRWGQVYLLDSLLRFVPERHADAEVMAERVAIQLQHANSSVVLTAIKALLYLMNYMADRRLIDHLCQKMGPPLGLCIQDESGALLMKNSSDPIIFGTRGPICRVAKHSAHCSAPANRLEERCQGVLLQVQRPNLCETCQT